MRARFIVLMTAAFIIMYVGYQQIAAQNLVTCPGLVQRAIDSVGSNCGGLDRNSACYGYSDVIANFSVAQPVSFFSQPSDRARLLELESLSTSPMAEALDKWGIALLSVQANLPDTLPGQSVIFMLLGDTQVENAVAPDQAFQTGATVNVTLSIGADLYYEPKLDAQVVGSIPQGTALTADAIDEGGQWVRVVYHGTPGWITRQVLTADGDLSALPVIGADTKTPMQAFYFRTGISGTQCTEAPNALVVQGPQSLTVDINVNGADMRLGSTIALYLLPVDAATLQYLVDLYGELGAISRLMQIVVLDGHVVLNAGTPDEIELNTGETTFICLNEPENLGADGQPNDQTVFSACPWALPRPVTLEDIERFRALEGVTLNYPIDLPLTLPTVTPTPSNTPRPFVYVAPTATFTPTPTPTDTPQQQQQQPPPPPQPTATATPCGSITNPVTDVPALIAAINIANCDSNPDTIVLVGETGYSFSTPDNTTDGANALPSVTSPITIDGNYASLTVPAGGMRIFHVGGAGDLTINNMTIMGGAAPGGSGGAIYDGGKVTLNNVNVNSNSADNGGGVYSTGTLILNSANIQSNTALNGGGVYSTGTLMLDKTTIAYNAGSVAGGGIYSGGSLTTLNSTISSNTGAAGAGLYNAGGSATVDFTTFYENTGGVNVEVPGGSVNAKNSLIGGSGTDCSGSVSSPGGSYQDDDTGACGGFTYAGQLGVIGLNELDPQGSPAIDGALDCTTIGGAVVSDDQYFTSRPQDNTGSGMGTCDAGSYELYSLF